MDSARRTASRRAGMAFALCCLVALFSAPAVFAAKGDCGQPSSTGATPKSSDALFVLKAAVGTVDCDLCVCDVTNDAKVTSTDALRILKKAVGQDVTLSCPGCTPKLTGIVRMPAALVSSLQATAVVGSSGLLPVEGATVELLQVDATGAPLLPPVATTTSRADGSYRFQPAPVPSSKTVVRATYDGEPEHAFVTGNVVDIDPASAFVFETALESLGAEPGADLGDLGLAEIDSLVALVRQADVDFSSAMSLQGAFEAIDDATGGIHGQYVADFATDPGPGPAMAGAFRLVNLGMSFERSFVPATPQAASVNSRSLDAYTTADPMTVDAEGAVAQASTTGRNHRLVEVSGASLSTGAVNASATLIHSDLNQSPGAATGTLLAADGGRLLANAQGIVAAGLFAAGGDFGVLPLPMRVNADSALGDLVLLLRQGAGLSNSSLSGTWWVVQLEYGFSVQNIPHSVHREIEVLTSANTATFDGNGNLSLGAPTGRSIRMIRDNPAPADPAADMLVQLAESAFADDAVPGLKYSLSPTGALTVKAGADVIASGAVTPDRNVFALRVGEESATDSVSGLVIGIRRGAGMNNASASGSYRALDAGVFLRHTTAPGVVDVTPSTNERIVGFSGTLGSVLMDGAGQVSVGKAVSQGAGLQENSGVLELSSEPDVVLDATTSIVTFTKGAGDNTETHAYSVASNGKVTVDGQATGFLSPDGKVFVLPNGGWDESLDSGLLIALREP